MISNQTPESTPCLLRTQLKLKYADQIFIHTQNLNKGFINASKKENTNSVDLQSVECLPPGANNSSPFPMTYTEGLCNLIDLNLSSSCLRALPCSFRSLKRLECVNLSSNLFSSLPTVLGELPTLRRINVSQNYIKEVSDNLANLVNLESLDISNNYLGDLPLNYKRLNRLTNLSLAKNHLKEIPKCVTFGMRLLQALDVSGNNACNLNCEPFSTKLRVFHAKDNMGCLTFPKWILNFQYSQLKEVLLDNTYFVTYDLPRKHFESHIRVLSMEQSNLSDSILEQLLNGMAYLEKLNIGNKSTIKHGNVLWSIPTHCLMNPSKLKEINVQATGISMIPQSINNYRNLVRINLSGNDVTWLPDEITESEKLESIMIEQNMLVALPDNIGQLKCLKELKASFNHLCHLPKSFTHLHKLKFFDVYSNDFTSLPEVLTQLRSLIGLDLEQNYFLTEGLAVANTSYQLMKNTLREYWLGDIQKLDGMRPHPRANSLEDTDFNCINRDQDDYPENSHTKTAVGNIPDREDNWDKIIYDSDDSFDPNENKERRMEANYLYSSPCLQQDHFSWPLNIHRAHIGGKPYHAFRKNASFFSQSVGGQFDDADED